MSTTGATVKRSCACVVLSGENRWRQVLQKTGVLELIEMETYKINEPGIEQMRVMCSVYIKKCRDVLR